MQVKTTLRFSLRPVKMAIIKNPRHRRYWKDVENEEHSSIAIGIASWKTTLEISFVVSQKIGQDYRKN